jgi:hypothetical protein
MSLRSAKRHARNTLAATGSTRRLAGVILSLGDDRPRASSEPVQQPATSENKPCPRARGSDRDVIRATLGVPGGA